MYISNSTKSCEYQALPLPKQIIQSFRKGLSLDIVHCICREYICKVCFSNMIYVDVIAEREQHYIFY